MTEVSPEIIDKIKQSVEDCDGATWTEEEVEEWFLMQTPELQKAIIKYVKELDND